MKSGYEQHFKKIKSAARGERPMSPPRSSPSPVAKPVAKSRPKKIRQGNAWGFIFMSSVGLICAVLGMLYADEVESFTQRVEIGWLGHARAQEAPAQTAKNPVASPSEPTTGGVTREPAAVDVDHLRNLVDRKKELDAREAEIVRQEGELSQLKVELESRLKDLERMRSEITLILADRVKTDDTKVDNLVQMYSNMRPPQAAKVFETMDEDLAVEILVRMKKKNAADIMNLLPAEKAQLFTERYAGYKK